ncbi:MAG TPA: type 4a pilus biogenesis protein PilO [Kofleriaceae bacterium]
MATSGAMADFARMPQQKKVLLFIGIGAVLLVLYWKLAYKSLDENIDAAEAQHTSNIANNKKLADDIPKYEELRAHKAKLDELNKKNQAALPQEADIPHFFETLQQKVTESGAGIRRWTNKPGEPVESFVRMPVEVELSGTFMQIKRFFASLVQGDMQLPGAERGEEPERIVSIENLALSSPTVVNREIVMTAKFTAVTFRQADKPVPPPGSPAAAGSNAPPRPAAPAANAPATPSAPALPSAAPAAAPPPLPRADTPAGAKARVDNAVDKTDTRNRAAAGVNDGSARLKGGL